MRERGRSISLKRPTAEIKTNGVPDAHARARARAEHALTPTRSLLPKFIREDLHHATCMPRIRQT